MDSLTFLERPDKTKPQQVYALFGDEHFLKRLVLSTLRRTLLGDDESFGLTTFEGDKVAFSEVHDELHTMPFLGPRRVVVVENADPFVTRNRAALEKYVKSPAASGVLILDVKTWQSTTNLAKQLGDAAAIACKAPAAYKLPEWCVRWAKQSHGKKLSAAAAKLLVDLVDVEMGLLDQELAKLAVFVGKAEGIETRDVDRLVGSSRGENIWLIFDAMGTGRVADALTILDGLFAQGDDALRILGAFSVQLRRLAAAAGIHFQGKPLATALEEAGVAPFARQGTEQQMRHLGRRRISRLYDWLLEMDLGLKGGSQLPPRALFEKFVIRLARPMTEKRTEGGRS